MTDTLDTTEVPANPEPGTAPDKAPASTPAPEASHQAEDADLDLLADDVDGGEGEDAEGTRAEGKTGEADAERPPAWQRPADLAGPDADPDAVAEWKTRQGLPVEADDYQIDLELKEGEHVSEAGQQLLDGLKEFGVEHDLPAPAVNGLAKFYKEQLQEQEVRLAEADKTLRAETRATLQEIWGDQHDERLEIAKEGARVLPQGLRRRSRSRDCQTASASRSCLMHSLRAHQFGPMMNQVVSQTEIAEICSKPSPCSASRLSRLADAPSAALSHGQDPEQTLMRNRNGR